MFKNDPYDILALICYVKNGKNLRYSHDFTILPGDLHTFTVCDNIGYRIYVDIMTGEKL